MPGESPNDAAQRRRERAERLAKVGALAPSAGSARATARALTGLPAGWSVLHYVVWPGRRGARIDHVVIGPGGVFVIASQAWSGTVSVEDDVLREDGRPRGACGGERRRGGAPGRPDGLAGSRSPSR